MPELGVGGAVHQVLHSGHCSSLAMFAMWTILLYNDVPRLSEKMG